MSHPMLHGSMDHPLAVFRAERGWSRQDLAEIARTTRQTIHRIETGEQQPSWNLAVRLIDISDGQLTADDFLPEERAA